MNIQKMEMLKNRGVKIIEDNYTRTYECVCPKCTSKFQFDRDCTAVIENKDISIKCPLCEEKIFLAKHKEDEFQNVTEVTKKKTKSTKKVLLEGKIEKPKATKPTKSKEVVAEESKPEVLPESQNA